MDLDEVARRQVGAFSRQQALASGLSREQCRRRLASGAWVRLTAKVYASAQVHVTAETRAWAGLLACEGRALLGVTSAALRWRMPVPHDGRIHLLVPPPVVVRLGTAYVVHRVPVNPREVTVLNGLRTTSCTRTVEDCLRVLDRQDAVTLLDRALQQGWIDLRRLREAAEEAPGRSGNTQLRWLARHADPAAQSAAERLLHRLLRSAGVTGWTASYRHPLGYVLDLAFTELRIGIEVDGWAWHSGRDRFQRDRTKQNVLVAAGWLVLRFTWWDLQERPDHVVRTIASVVAARS